jgi:hypothetical protein
VISAKLSEYDNMVTRAKVAIDELRDLAPKAAEVCLGNRRIFDVIFKIFSRDCRIDFMWDFRLQTSIIFVCVFENCFCLILNKNSMRSEIWQAVRETTRQRTPSIMTSVKRGRR